MEDQPVRALITTLAEARRLGAMALFGEKYGDVVRMVEVGDGSFSRELCGGTHVRYTAEIGAFRITGETSSARNVRRIEALTGPAAIELLREYDRELQRTSQLLRVPPERVADTVSDLRARVSESERTAAGRGGDGAVDIEPLLSSAVETDGARVLVAAVTAADGKALLDLADRLKAKLGDAAIVLGSAGDDRVDLVASVAPSLVARRVKAGEIVKAAAAAAGGGGGGRDTLARAGGRHPEKLPAALEAAREAIEAALRVRVLALDYGSARCGCAVSDPSGTIATPLEPVLAPRSKRGLRRLTDLVLEQGAERVVVGLPLSLSGADTEQTAETRAFAASLAEAVAVPLELYDERLTTRLAARLGGRASEDSRAAALVLEGWLAARRASVA